MILSIHNKEFEVTPENSAAFTGNTLMNGMYTDLDDDYVFIPEQIDGYDSLITQAINEGIPVYELEEYDPNAPPFCFMINALCRIFRDEVNELSDGR